MSQPSSSAPLYQHQPHPHTPRSANDRHAEERQARGKQPGLRGRMSAFNEALAVFLTAYVGTMWTAYGFSALAIVGLFGVLAILNPNVYTLIAWLSQTFIQLVLLPVIMVGQNVLNRHAEIQADEQFHATERTLHESEQMMRHLNAQDDELLRQTALLRQLLGQIGGRDTRDTRDSIESLPPTPKPLVTTPPKRSHRRKVATP